MSIHRVEILKKIKELLLLNPRAKSIGVDTLSLIFRVSIDDILIKLVVLETEGLVKVYTIRETTNKKKIFMVSSYVCNQVFLH